MHRGRLSDGDRSGLITTITKLGELQFGLVAAIAEELSDTNDMSIAKSFLAWRRNPRISSLVEMAMNISTDDLDQLLFLAEDYYSHTTKKRLAGPPPAEA